MRCGTAGGRLEMGYTLECKKKKKKTREYLKSWWGNSKKYVQIRKINISKSCQEKICMRSISKYFVHRYMHNININKV